MPEPKNEQAICGEVKRYFAEVRKQPVEPMAQSDKIDRKQKAVEEVFRIGDEHFPVEHTRIKSFEADC